MEQRIDVIFYKGIVEDLESHKLQTRVDVLLSSAKMEKLVFGYNQTSAHQDIQNEIHAVQNWFFMRSPIPVAAIMISYWLFVLKVGPKYMKSREPFQVKKHLVAYNIFQVFLSLYLSVACINFLRAYGFFPSICPGDPADSKMIMIYRGSYLYLVAKITELLDTVFFVLRKNSHQVTFLHVYHHSITILVAWIAIKIDSVYPSASFIGAINGLVHVVMYTYYGLSAFPSMTKYLWWKKYITKLQLVQFVTIIAHHFVWYKVAKCEKFNLIFLTIIFHLFLFIYLFLDFYVKTYVNNKNIKTIFSLTEFNNSSNLNGQNKIKQN